jgi:hypothetical protein
VLPGTPSSQLIDRLPPRHTPLADCTVGSAAFAFHRTTDAFPLSGSISERRKTELSNKGMELSKPEYLVGGWPIRLGVTESGFAAHAQCCADL